MRKYVIAFMAAAMTAAAEPSIDDTAVAAMPKASALAEAYADYDAERCRELLAAGAEVKDVPPLHFAVLMNDIDTCKRLIAAGVDVNAPDRPSPNDPDGQGQGYTPLMLAAERGYADICRLLIEASAEPDKCTLYECITPLSLAAKQGYADICRMLLDAKADANACTRTCSTPLMLAAREAQVEVCRILLGAGSEVNAFDRYDMTPLHCVVEGAAMHDQMPPEELRARRELIALLLSKGADKTMRDRNGRTPAELAAELKRPELAEELARSRGGEDEKK